jgi:predicted DNA-binding protein
VAKIKINFVFIFLIWMRWDFVYTARMSETESVRISKELKQQLKQMAQSMRPRTAVQYLIEDAIEQYLDRVAEETGSAYQVKPASKAKKKA